MKKASIFSAIIVAIFVMASSASAELKTASTSFAPMITAATTNTINVTGEVLSIGIRSSNTNAYSVSITDFATGAPIYTGTGLTSTSYNLFPRIAATGTTGAAVTNGNGTIYVPASVAKMRVVASCTTAASNSLTVATVVNAAP
jgi:hypothetical protein